ncbi:MAG: hypothetical protein NC930_01275 [Candidatus Omnitrophica bacterium]|nr:hypothetical protein [Candidatus Omnitrophota bacterium]
MVEPDSSLTPEKRLLALIEQVADATPVAVKEPQEVKETAPAAPVLTPAAVLERLSRLKDNLIAFAKNEGPPINFHEINRGAKIFTLGLSIFFVGATGYEVVISQKALQLDLDITPREIASPDAVGERRYEIDLFKDPTRRNVFVPYVEEKVVEKVDKKKELSLKLLEITKDFKLAGISVYPGDASRTFCMVEDVKKNITSFLKVGDTISGLKVTEIKPDSIVLEHADERIELR